MKSDSVRGQVSEDEIKTRIETALKELTYEKYYDYSVVNPQGHPEKAINQVEEIIKNELKNK
jgi:guanylate kinase